MVSYSAVKAQAYAARIDALVLAVPKRRHWRHRCSHSADRADRTRNSSDGRSKYPIGTRNRRLRVEDRQQQQGGKGSGRARQVEYRWTLRVVTLTAHGAAAVVLVGGVVVRGGRARRCSSAATINGPRVLRLMAGTVPRFHAARLRLRRGRGRMRHLPLQTERELKHQQRRKYPVCGSVRHDSQRTPAAVMREARHVASGVRGLSHVCASLNRGPWSGVKFLVCSCATRDGVY